MGSEVKQKSNPIPIGLTKCRDCGVQVLAKLNCNSKIYYNCGCGCSVRFSELVSYKGRATLRRGESFQGIEPLEEYKKNKTEEKQQNERVENGQRGTTGQRGRVEESGENQSGDDDDEYF